MKEAKLKSIRTIGIVLAVVSTLQVISSVMGLFMVDYLADGTGNTVGISYYEETLTYAKPLAVISILIGICFLIAGIFIIRYKNWARVFAQAVGLITLIYLWYQAIFIAPNNPFDKGEFSIEQIMGSLFWSIPILILVFYLNNEKVKSYFT